MPYQLEKGPYFSVTESMLNFGGNCAERLALLKLMIRGTDPNQLPTVAVCAEPPDGSCDWGA